MGASQPREREKKPAWIRRRPDTPGRDSVKQGMENGGREIKGRWRIRMMRGVSYEDDGIASHGRITHWEETGEYLK